MTHTPATQPRLGRLATAMVTAFNEDGSLDLDGVRRLATELVDEQANDSVVVNGTTGESPTTTEDEKFAVVAATLEAVGDRANVIAGVGSFDTAHTVRMAKRAEQTGAHGLLVVTPYYSRPVQDGIIAHFRAVADATDLPVMVYDIPGRTATAIEADTLIALAEHPNIVAVKDAKGDVVSSSRVIAETGLDYYAGDDAITLPLMSVGGVGVVGTSTHFTGRGMREIIDAVVAGDYPRALAAHRRWLPAFTRVFGAPGCCTVKGGLRAEGRGVGSVRLPMVAAPEAVVTAFLDALHTAEQG
ncbi:4-hydroxy-tetrahydrodipicolinate synthase [Aestuariimicrobium sp. Y1814]|uniref:4-hydroxy-tetrahydrodipicolinate synthase n=1 Tax=Aestuariimicrobium sp. Y1814 TaxID=3418742 RepID=UPI003DA6F9D3